jgi:hypothetical protein
MPMGKVESLATRIATRHEGAVQSRVRLASNITRIWPGDGIPTLRALWGRVARLQLDAEQLKIAHVAG